MAVRRGVGAVLVGAGLVVLSCGADRGGDALDLQADAGVSHASASASANANGSASASASASETALPESRAAATRIAELRARFRLPVRGVEEDRRGRAHAGHVAPVAATAPGVPAKRAGATTRSALGAAVATRFESGAGADATTHVRAVLPSEARRGVARAARVALPVHANDEVKLEDEMSHLSVSFALEHVQDARIEVAGGMALYRAAFDGADVVHRVHPEGTEDFVVFETRPAREEIRYSVDVSRVPGLRLVSNTLEFLDDSGTPLLRVAPPYVVDARGAPHDARLAVSGCAYDTTAAGPWGRLVTRPSAERCTVRIAWAGDVEYPVLVDPTWTTTGSMAYARYRHTASVLPSGRVLVAGGVNGTAWSGLASAELFDVGNAGAGSFAATGAMGTARVGHTATVLPSGKVLVAGGNVPNGGSAVYLASAELYDPAGKAGAGTFTATGALATARSGHAASVLVSGKVLVAGGQDNANSWGLATAELFDAAANGGAGSFAATGSMAFARFHVTASLLPSGKVLVASDSSASAELFDPAGNAGAGSFAATGPMTGASQDGLTSTALPSGKVLVMGTGPGSLHTPGSGYSQLFDPTGNAGIGTFTSANLGWNNGSAASVVPPGKVLVTGGWTYFDQDWTVYTYYASATLWDPAGSGGAGSSAAIARMNTARGDHTASVLPSGLVLVAGGYDMEGGCVANQDCLGTPSARAEVLSPTRGDACVTDDACPTGFCVDGVCCNSACAGACDRCDLVNSVGTCMPVPSGDPGASDACAAPFACDGVGPTCPTSCTTDAACAPAYYCASNGSCLPRKAQGAACNSGTGADCKAAGCRVCISGFCVDGVCCNTACSGVLCQACVAALKQSGDTDGTCGPTKDGVDPRGDCAPLGTACGPDGMCNGTGACRLATPAGVSCGVGMCEGTVAHGDLCNGSGACVPNPGGVECSPFLCSGGGCTTNCATSDDCATDGWCNGAKCENRRANGQPCEAKEQCFSNICADGVCCTAPCSGQCEACDIAGAEGSCAPLTGEPHGARAACAPGSATNPCSAAQCNGIERATCAGLVGPNVTCGQASCTRGTETRAGMCNGKGACTTPAPIACGAYACGATACKTTCAVNEDCAQGSRCDAATAKCISGATCDGDHTTTGANGATQDCAPYKCDKSGTCNSTCSSVYECVAPAVCDPTGKCIPKPEGTGRDDGCTVVGTGAGRAPRPIPWIAAAAVLAQLRRRRRLVGDGLRMGSRGHAVAPLAANPRWACDGRRAR